MLDIIFLGLSALGLVMNVLLIAMALRISHRPREMSVTLGLAAIDLALAGVNISAVVYHLGWREPIDKLPLACDLKGAFDLLGVFVSMLLVSLIAILRVTRVFSCRVPRGLSVFLTFLSVGFFSLVVASASRSEFRILPDGIDCAPESETSTLSKALLIMDAFGLLIFLFIAVGCYLCIFIATAASNGHKSITESTESLLHPWKDRLPILMRTAIIIISYLVIVLPPIGLLFLEAFLQKDKVSSLNIPIDLFLASIPLLNPTLVLFAHSLIFQQLSQSVRSLVHPSST